MKKNLVIAWIIVGVAVIAGLAGWLTAFLSQKPVFKETAHLQETVRTQNRENEALQKEVTKLTQTVKELKGEGVLLSKPTGSIPGTLAQAAGKGMSDASGVAREKKNGLGDMVSQMMSDPRMQEMIQAQHKTMIEKMYGPFFKELGLKPEEIEAVMNVLLDSQAPDIKKAMTLLNGTEEEKKRNAQEMSDQHRQAEEKIKQLLGEEKYSKYQEYQKSLPSRMSVDQFKQELVARNLSLTEAQEKQLLQAVQEESQKGMENLSPSTTPGIPNSPEMVKALMDKRHEACQRIVDRAGSFLSSEQAASLASFYERQVNMEEMSMQFMGKMTGSPDTGNTSTTPSH